jgi:hypothetical protein
MGFFSLYIITMSKDDEDYLDDPEILDFNENLDARAAQQMEEGITSPLMFGRTGRGSPMMDRQSPYDLSRNAAEARRKEGFKDDKYLKNIKNLEPFNEQQKKEAEDEKQLDAYLDNMYKEEKKGAEDDARLDAYLDNMYEEMKPRRQKGGTRKRNKRSIKRNKRSTRRNKRRSRRNKRSSRRNKRK